MAKDKQKNGGNNKGSKNSVADKIAASEAGRARKRALRKQHEAAKTKHLSPSVGQASLCSTEERLKEQFYAECRETSTDLSVIVEGKVGAKVLVLVHDGEKVAGRLIVKVIAIKKGAEAAVKVVGSDYASIAPSKWHLPLRALHVAYFPGYYPDEARQALVPLWKVLKRECYPLLAAQVAKKLEKWEGRAPQFGITKSNVDVADAERLRGWHLMSGGDAGKLFFIESSGSGRAYFRKKGEGDSITLTLVGADEYHPFAPILGQHAEVEVNGKTLYELLRGKPVKVHDLKERDAVEKFVGSFLSRLMPSIGLRPKVRTTVTA